jgi:shikimate dehydrogenase
VRFAVIGHPIAHSKSPLMHAAAYRALGLEHTYERIDTPHDQLPHRVAELRHHDLDGINVTVPHKQAVLELVDEIAPSARAIGAANTLLRDAAGRIVAHNTDAPALTEEILRLLASDPPTAGSAVVIGSGGAARAAVFALGTLGFRHIEVRARRPLEGAEHALIQAPLLAPARERDDLAVIVQCTTAGMDHGAPGTVAVDAIAWDTVPPHCIAYDVVYAPPLTPFLQRARHLRHDNGFGMLVAQGAIAFELWLGVAPPRDVMRAALDAK